MASLGVAGGKGGISVVAAAAAAAGSAAAGASSSAAGPRRVRIFSSILLECQVVLSSRAQ